MYNSNLSKLNHNMIYYMRDIGGMFTKDFKMLEKLTF